VIRREILILEGDPFNSTKLKESINALKRLGYFNSVKYRIERGIIDNSVDIIINVEEMNTGSVSLGFGYSSLNSTSITFGLNEKNFLGEGTKARFEANMSDKKSNYNVGITEPYFLDKPISFSTNFYNQESENNKGDIKSDELGFGLGLGIKEKLIFHSLGYSYAKSSSTTSTTSTATSVTGEEGINIITSSIKYSILKDTRDSYFNPSSGYKWSLINTLAGIGGDARFVKSIAKYQVYYPINYNDYTLAFKTGLGSVNSLDDKITRSNRFNLGGRVIRGFDNGGIGPRDIGNKQAVGGNNFYNISTELRSDKFMPDDTGIEWILFSDIASLWGTDYETGVEGFDDIEPRITSGFGLLMNTAVGPLQFLWGFPIQSKSYDVEENFQFSIGTNF
jgi:outer membrane protein insertion porin family